MNLRTNVFFSTKYFIHSYIRLSPFLRFIYEIYYFLSLLASISCQTSPEGLRVTPDGTGPMIVVDWDAEPFPNFHFPII